MASTFVVCDQKLYNTKYLKEVSKRKDGGVDLVLINTEDTMLMKHIIIRCEKQWGWLKPREMLKVKRSETDTEWGYV
jgi:hypothetical protein